jgi:hypothetical protein
MISISAFSATIHSLNSFRLATGSIIGVLILIYFIDKIKNSETKNIVMFGFIIILCLGINLKKIHGSTLYFLMIKLMRLSRNVQK